MSHDPIQMADDFAVAQDERDLAAEQGGRAGSRIAEIAARLKAATPGPWRWGGNVDCRDVYLSTVHHGRVMVMTFDRWGMQGAAPTFWDHQAEEVRKSWGGSQQKIADSAVREVPYRGDIDRLDNPDAELIASAPADIEFLLGLANVLRELVEARDAYDLAEIERDRLLADPDETQTALAELETSYDRLIAAGKRQDDAWAAAGKVLGEVGESGGAD